MRYAFKLLFIYIVIAFRYNYWLRDLTPSMSMEAADNGVKSPIYRSKSATAHNPIARMRADRFFFDQRIDRGIQYLNAINKVDL